MIFPCYRKPFKSKTSKNFRSSHRMCSLRKCVLRNFAKCKGKHLCQSLFFNNVAGLRFFRPLVQLSSKNTTSRGCLFRSGLKDIFTYKLNQIFFRSLFGSFSSFALFIWAICNLRILQKTNKLITNIKMLYILISVKVMPDPCNFLVRALSNFEKTFWLGLLSLSRFRNLLLSLVFNDNFREIRPI